NADARRYQLSLNNTQAKPNADGSVTFVIAPSAPGIANWLDTTGLHDGCGIIRWQAVPAGATPNGLVREFRVIKTADLAAMKDLPRVTPEQRRAQVAARTDAYNTRVL